MYCLLNDRHHIHSVDLIIFYIQCIFALFSFFFCPVMDLFLSLCLRSLSPICSQQFSFFPFQSSSNNSFVFLASRLFRWNFQETNIPIYLSIYIHVLNENNLFFFLLRYHRLENSLMDCHYILRSLIMFNASFIVLLFLTLNLSLFRTFINKKRRRIIRLSNTY